MIEVTENNLGKYVDFENEYLNEVSGIIDEIQYEQYIVCWINDEDEEVFEIVHPRDISHIHE